MKTLAFALLLAVAPAALAEHISRSSMGGDIDVPHAPHGATLRTMGGNIRVGRAEGRVVAKTMGGDIEVRRLSGPLEAGTMGGNVDVEVLRGDGDIEISSMGGRIELTLPANFSGTFEVQLEQDDDGPRNEITSDFPLQIQERKKDHWIRRDTTVLTGTGRTGTGAHHVKITTIGGDIRIRRK